MTTNARTLTDPSKDQSGFSKLPTPQELAAMKAGGTGATDKGTKKELILGKFETVEALQASYRELEQRLGLQGQEVGQLRQLTDKLLDLKKTEDGAKGSGRTAAGPVTSDELLRDPQAAISRVVQETTASLENQLAQQNRLRAQEYFQSKHPTYLSDMNDPEFQSFIRATPYRQNLAAKTVKEDIQAADELWGAWEEHKASKAPAAKGKTKEEIDREQALKDATGMVTGSGGTGTAEGDSSNAGKPIYSRQQIVMMRINNPQGYYDPAFQEMLHQAYIEKRVR